MTMKRYNNPGAKTPTVDEMNEAIAASATTSGLTLLATVEASDSSTVDIEDYFDTTYDEYEVHGCDITSSAATSLYIRLKTTSWISSGYSFVFSWAKGNSTSNAGYAVNNQGFIETGYGIGGNSTQKSSFKVTLPNPQEEGSVYKPVGFNTFSTLPASNYTAISTGMGHSTSIVSAVTGIRFYPSTGTLTGTFRLYGVAK